MDRDRTTLYLDLFFWTLFFLAMTLGPSRLIGTTRGMPDLRQHPDAYRTRHGNALRTADLPRLPTVPALAAEARRLSG